MEFKKLTPINLKFVLLHLEKQGTKEFLFAPVEVNLKKTKIMYMSQSHVL